MPGTITKMDLPNVRGFFQDLRAGNRVDEILAQLLYKLATQYKPPVPDTVVRSAAITFAEDDATPSVLGGTLFVTANANATTITDFGDGVEGQEIVVLIGDAVTTIDFSTGTNITGNGGSDLTAAAGDTIRFVNISGVWRGFVSVA